MKDFLSISRRLEPERADVPVRILKQCLILAEVVGNSVLVIYAVQDICTLPHFPYLLPSSFKAHFEFSSFDITDLSNKKS